MNRIILKAKDLDGFLTDRDKKHISEMDDMYSKAKPLFDKLASSGETEGSEEDKNALIDIYNTLGNRMQEITAEEPGIHVYSFETPREIHGEASRLIAKLRSTSTQQQEFVYYIQRAYELLFNLAFDGANTDKKNYFVVKTPVNIPVQNYAIHKIPDLDDQIENSVMCVMLRGALLPDRKSVV